MKFNFTLRQISKIGGITLLLMAILSIYAFAIVLSTLYDQSSPTNTLSNISTHQLLFFSGNITWLIILVLDIIVAFSFYAYFKSSFKMLAMAICSLRLIYTFIFGIGIIFLFFSNLQQFMYFWSLGLIIIGLHLCVTGFAVWKSAEIPILISLLLIVAGLSYSIIHGIYIFLPAFESLGKQLESILAIPMTVGELSFGIWLIAFGGKIKRQK